ncbi:hypothetical protein F5144DRAFT_200535 [Chaetomium tenue]|uniref:Uncharacterized protein n=1 Tax=Chaetomium tenue TaxID=1854479 RepID=A0ACB7PCV8_9PEZI|nr:hypothetical protein F5144DRAFT_200535 [Chaetomium globosum]
MLSCYVFMWLLVRSMCPVEILDEPATVWHTCTKYLIPYTIYTKASTFMRHPNNALPGTEMTTRLSRLGQKQPDTPGMISYKAHNQ